MKGETVTNERTGAVYTEVIDDRILLTTISRPEARNALDASVASGLLAAARQLEDDPRLRVGVLHGANGVFCSGMDLRVFREHGPAPDLMPFFTMRRTKPSVAAIDGLAIAGGLEVALTCDVLVASKNARFGIPEVKVGLFAAGGAITRLPRRLPLSLALELALTGDLLDAESARSHGLVNRVTESADVLEVALAIAGKIADNAPLAVVASKRLMLDSLSVSESEFWGMQEPVIDAVFGSADALEGATAFLEKRAPSWTGE